MTAGNTPPSVRKLVLMFCVALAFATVRARASVDMFLDLGPDIPGESKDT
jgi:hypothetical protein